MKQDMAARLKPEQRTNAKSSATRKDSLSRDGAPDSSTRWDLKLYIAGETPRSRAAVQNLKRICDEYMDSDYSIEVIDLIKNPSLARGDQIVALPTLVRKIPAPMRKIIGDLSNVERVLVGLDLRPRSKAK